MCDDVWRRLATEYQHLPYTVDVYVDISDDPFDIYQSSPATWCDVECEAPWDLDFIPYSFQGVHTCKIRFFFESEKEAVIFKLRWV